MEEFYTINQAAIVLKVHPLTVRRYIKEGKLKAYRAAGNVRVAVNDLRAFTQNFAPSTTRQPRNPQTVISPTKEFTFADPFFQLKGKGASMSRIEQ